MAAKLGLLVVDGYNIIWGIERYRRLIDEDIRAHSLADTASLSRDPYGQDPFERAREALAADVATYAQDVYEPTIVYDAADNLNPRRPTSFVAGVRVIFSDIGETADARIEKMVAQARRAGREVVLATSDNTIRTTAGGIPVTSISAALFATNLDDLEEEVHTEKKERTQVHLTLADRLSAQDRKKLQKLLGE